MQIKKSKNFIEYIGHFDDNVLCAKLTLLADLYAIEHKVGYAKFDIKDEDKLNLINDKLDYLNNPYLTFSSPNTFTLGTADYSTFWNGTLQYSTDTTNWTTWDGTAVLNSSSSGDTKYLYLRGTNNTYITGPYWDDDESIYPRFVLTGSNISCSGNIENLLDYQTAANGQHPTMANSCYAYMFYYCTSLTTAPELPATTLTENCYCNMFYGCTSLTTAPELPATTLANSCYCYMFGGCTSLTTAPELPATILTDYCYSSMFGGCTSLTTAPELPATTLANYCYHYMFVSCRNLTTVPILPATTLASNCYNSMFQYCTSLTTVPKNLLPATTLATYCYANMFQYCTSLTTAPSLPATTLAIYCYIYMFQGCTNLTTVPELPATTLAGLGYYYMFQGCSKIKLSTTQTGEYTQEYRIPISGSGTTVPDALTNMFTNTGGTFKGTPTINTTYYLSNTNTIIPSTPPNTYSLTHNLTNLTSSNKTIQITPDTGYYLPSSITVTNGTLVSYNSTTGIAVISGDNAVVIAECSDTQVVSGYSGNIAITVFAGSLSTSSYIKFDSAPTSAVDYNSAVSNGVLYGDQSYTNKSVVYIWGNRSNNGVIINNNTTAGGLSYDTAVQLNLTEDATIYLKCYATSG